MSLKEKFSDLFSKFEKDEDCALDFIIAPTPLVKEMLEFIPEEDRTHMRSLIVDFNMIAFLWSARVFVAKNASKIVYGSGDHNVAYTIDTDLNLESIQQINILTFLSRAKF
jgi:hypothetical protein